MANLRFPPDLTYSAEHAWLRIEDDHGLVGITDFAQHELGDIVFIELPAPGVVLKAGSIFGSIESVKTVSDLYAPVCSTVLETNSTLGITPELVNQDPYLRGWIIKVRMDNPAEGAALLSASEYEAVIRTEK